MSDFEIIKTIQDMKAKQKRLKNLYGDVKPIFHVEYLEYHFVAIGDYIHYSNKWKTFVDFLIYYIWHIFGKDWINQEKNKQESERHIILHWWNSTLKFIKTQKKNDEGVFFSKPSGPFKAFVTLAYDLYLLAHHEKLQDQFIERLKNSDQFQGVRYELFVVSTLIRAGFEIEYEDETDRSDKHVEFIAKHKQSKEIIAIEAKSKHRPGVLSYPGEIETVEDIRVRVGRLINSAIAKKPKLPYIIFIDLNLPPEKMDVFDDPKLKELIKTLKQTNKTNDDKDLFNSIFYTNFPYHYGNEFDDFPEDHLGTVISLNPLFPLTTKSIIEDLQIAVKKYGRIPRDFSEFKRY